MKIYLEEDLCLPHLPVVISAQHHLGDPLTGSFEVLLIRKSTKFIRLTFNSEARSITVFLESVW